MLVWAPKVMEVENLKHSNTIDRETALASVNLEPYFYFHGRQACIEKAMAKPLPGAAEDAFLNGGIKVAGRTIWEVMPVHLKCLQALKSPMLLMVESATSSKDKKSDAEFDESEERELCYIFTEKPEVLEDTPKGERVELIKSKAKEIFGKCLAAEINMTVVAIMEQFNRHIQTSVKFAAEIERSGDVRFFRDLNPMPPKPAESGGFSPTSAATGNTTPPI